MGNRGIRAIHTLPKGITRNIITSNISASILVDNKPLQNDIIFPFFPFTTNEFGLVGKRG